MWFSHCCLGTCSSASTDIDHLSPNAGYPIRSGH
jgi:hypothetical protein